MPEVLFRPARLQEAGLTVCLDEILRAMGFRPSKEELTDILAEIDEKGELTEFYQLCTKFLVEDVDDGENIHVYDHGTLSGYKLLHHSDSDKLVEDFRKLKSIKH